MCGITDTRETLPAARRAGASFDTAWSLALRDVGGMDRSALQWSKAAWCAAYQGRPAGNGERAAASVRDLRSVVLAMKA